jgi:hypothetical protein
MDKAYFGGIEFITVPPVIVYEDNTSTIRASENPVEHSKLNHLEINYHSIRDYVQSEDIIMQSVYSIEQLAD